jgi:cold shock CspA family protein
MKGRITSIKRAKPGVKFTKGCGSGFGFIKDEAGVDRFFPNGNVTGCSFDELQEGLDVEFEPYNEPGKGERARNVRVTS